MAETGGSGQLGFSSVTSELLEQLSRATDEAKKGLAEATTMDQLADLERVLTGKQGPFGEISRAVGSLDVDGKKVVGAALNAARADLKELAAARRTDLSAQERAAKLEVERLDLTEILGAPRDGHIHLITRTRYELEDVFIGMGFTVAEGPEVEDDWHNFEALNFPPGHPARSSWDTFWVDLGQEEQVLLRTHTSPVQIRVMESQKPPIYSVMPGQCFRRETPDARHLAVFNQIEGLVIDKGITFGDLAGCIDTFTQAYFGPGIHARLRPAFFPFTEPSAEFEVVCFFCKGDGCRTCSKTGWIELGGCGMVDPNVLTAVGIDPEEYSGFAFGFGIERCAQLRHDIDDMRVLLDNDIRFLTQF
jgi:phenylalanyl-tRNA synthetase alpha chain